MLNLARMAEKPCRARLIASINLVTAAASNSIMPNSDRCYVQASTPLEVCSSFQALSTCFRSTYTPHLVNLRSMHPCSTSFAARAYQNSIPLSPASQTAYLPYRAFHATTVLHHASTTPAAVAPSNSYSSAKPKSPKRRSFPGALQSATLGPLPLSLISQGVPRILIADPWIPIEAHEERRLTMQACLDALRAAGPDAALTAEQVHEQVASMVTSRLPSNQMHAYVRRLLEHLRDKRLILGRSNPSADVARGHPNYPYLYTALPYQLLHKGPPALVAKQQAEQQAKREARARRRLRRGKPPFAIHRQVARSSCLQHALAYESVVKAQEKLGFKTA